MTKRVIYPDGVWQDFEDVKDAVNADVVATLCYGDTYHMKRGDLMVQTPMYDEGCTWTKDEWISYWTEYFANPQIEQQEDLSPEDYRAYAPEALLEVWDSRPTEEEYLAAYT
jgi:hypothetical protein